MDWWRKLLWPRRGGDRDASGRPLLARGELSRLARLAEKTVVTRRDGAQSGGERVSARRGQGLDFQELRRYQAGDDVRAMDWRTTARTGVPHVRVYHQERRPSIFLVVDLGASMRFGTRVRLKAAQAARIAVYLALRTSGEGGAVGGVLLGDAMIIRPMRCGRAHAIALARALALPCPPSQEGCGGNPDRVLGALTHDLPGGTEIVILTDLHWLEPDRVEVLARLAATDRPVRVVAISDTAERSLPNLGRVPFSLPESDGPLWVDTARPGIRAAFEAHVARRTRARRGLLARAGLSLLEVGSETPARVWARQFDAASRAGG